MRAIKIQDFRCFKELQFELKPGINLFIGDNASGKTALMWACKYAMNCFFSGFSSIYTSWTTPNRDDYRQVFTGEKKLSPDPINISFDFYADEMPDAGVFSLRDISLTLYKRYGKNSRPWITPLMGLRDYGVFLSRNQITGIEENEGEYIQPYELPLIASFSTHGIHNNNNKKIDPKFFLEYGQSPDFGYYMCHSTDGLLSHWIKRLLILKEADHNPVEREIVINALKSFFGDDGCDIMTDFDVRVNLKEVVCRFKDNREIPVSLLSDGYKRLFSIVLDIAFRCALLNSLKFGRRAASLTHGTVIIDEIDQHLHPSLQAIVLKAFKLTFPNIQFIASTHAPMVMSGVESDERNQVILMKFDEGNQSYSIENAYTYGMDMSTLTKVVLGLPSRNVEVEMELNKLSCMIDDGNLDDAKQLLYELKERFENRIPELSGMETEIALEETFNGSDREE